MVPRTARKGRKKRKNKFSPICFFFFFFFYYWDFPPGNCSCGRQCGRHKQCYLHFFYCFCCCSWCSSCCYCHHKQHHHHHQHHHLHLCCYYYDYYNYLLLCVSFCFKGNVLQPHHLVHIFVLVNLILILIFVKHGPRIKKGYCQAFPTIRKRGKKKLVFFNIILNIFFSYSGPQ